MKNAFFILILPLIVLSESCSDLKVTADYDKGVDFTAYKTFNIMRYQEGVVESTPLSMMTVSFIEEAIINELMARGYTLSDNPDIEVYYYVKLADKTEYVNSGPSVGVSTYYGSPYYYGYHGGYAYASEVRSMDYTEGALIVELVDNKGDMAVWQGVAKKSVTKNTAQQKEINHIVNRIFYNYKWKTDTESAIPEKSQAPKETY